MRTPMLLEREAQLAALAERFERVDDAGRLVLVTGEAGAGKSSLVEVFLAQRAAGARVLVGRCDDLFAPRPFGPVADIARSHPGRLAAALEEGDPAGVADVFLDTLAAPPTPVVLVLEDLQWADDATLDLLRIVTRRLDTLPCFVLATQRSDLAPDHPLRRVAGSLVGPLVTRVPLPPLSVDAVRVMADGSGLDAEVLHARTAGNPFFVTELLADARAAVPGTVQDAVTARAAALSGPARDALDAAAVLGRRTEPDLLAAVADCEFAAIDECVAAGLLMHDGSWVAFRHDLTRDAVEGTLTPLRRRQLHGRALDALDALAADGLDVDLVRRANHAIASERPARMLELAAAAAAQCVALGAFREAASLYGQAVVASTNAPPGLRYALLEAQALTCERVEQLDDAIRAGEAILDLVDGGDERVVAIWESWLGGVLRVVGRGDEAWALLGGAVARLERLGESKELARALGLLSQHQMVCSHSADAIVTGRRAQAMAERFGAEDVAVHALVNVASAMCCLGDEDGFAVFDEAIDRAGRAGVHHEVTRGTLNLSEALLVRAMPAVALPRLDHGLDVANAYELRYNRNGLLAWRGWAYYLLGRWDDAVRDLQAVLAEPDLSDSNRCFALLRLGCIRARRGDPGAGDAFDEALALATPYNELQVVQPVYIARAEHAWLRGDLDAARAEVDAVIASYAEHPEPWHLGALAVWAARLDVAFEPLQPLIEPYELMRAGDARGAAAAWDARGCAYDAADALADSADPSDLRVALEQLTALGGRPRAQQVTRRLRELGVRDVPRGPRASTRANPAGLTARELEVARLLGGGLSNTDIAVSLVLSPKTVDHHVSAVLAKLGINNRRHVAGAAAAIGLDLKDEVAATGT